MPFLGITKLNFHYGHVGHKMEISAKNSNFGLKNKLSKFLSEIEILSIIQIFGKQIGQPFKTLTFHNYGNLGIETR